MTSRIVYAVPNLIVTLILAIAVSCVISLFSSQQSAQAANAKNFNPGRIIDDAVFYNSSTMSAGNVQTFLNSKVPRCETDTQPYQQAKAPCLKNYTETTKNKAADSYCRGYTGRSNESAAQIVYNVARSCGINPQVLIVILEKEQSLVTDTWPRDSWLNKHSGGAINYQYRSAMGMGCPDTAPCDSAYYGFFNQVYLGARQYKMYKVNARSYNYIAGRENKILWNPNSSCGSSQVYIQNQATAALYIYTPYRPNKAALNNLYGTGDACSSYGNRNFWRIFTDWFGSTVYTVKGAIGSKYNDLGGITGFLGSPTMNERCGLRDNGCYQLFQGGSIYWTQNSGAHAIWGGIRAQWSSYGVERGPLGYPTSEEMSFNEGMYQDFTGGRIYWTNGSAKSTFGAIGSRYKTTGYHLGALGLPITNEACNLRGGGCYQSYQNGAIVWTNASNAWESMNGKIRQRWAATNFENGPLGYPTGPEVCGLKDGGCFQSYQNGAIVGSAAAQYWATYGGIRQRWAATNFENGPLGYPTGPEVCGLKDGGCFQSYQNGAIVWTNASNAWESMNGKIRQRWAATNFENGPLGYPTGPESKTASGGQWQQYQNGVIVGSDTTGYWENRGAIRQKWASLNFEYGKLGYPISNEKLDKDGNTYQQYQNGKILWTKTRGAWVE